MRIEASSQIKRDVEKLASALKKLCVESAVSLIEAYNTQSMLGDDDMDSMNSLDERLVISCVFLGGTVAADPAQGGKVVVLPCWGINDAKVQEDFTTSYMSLQSEGQPSDTVSVKLRKVLSVFAEYAKKGGEPNLVMERLGEIGLGEPFVKAGAMERTAIMHDLLLQQCFEGKELVPVTNADSFVSVSRLHLWHKLVSTATSKPFIETTAQKVEEQLVLGKQLETALKGAKAIVKKAVTQHKNKEAAQKKQAEDQRRTELVAGVQARASAAEKSLQLSKSTSIFYMDCATLGHLAIIAFTDAEFVTKQRAGSDIFDAPFLIKTSETLKRLLHEKVSGLRTPKTDGILDKWESDNGYAAGLRKVKLDHVQHKLDGTNVTGSGLDASFATFAPTGLVGVHNGDPFMGSRTGVGREILL